MAITFSELNLKTKDEVKVIKINDKEIEVKQYLPAADKNAILELTIQEADRGTVVNTFALECLFHLYLVMKCTNIEFSEEDLEDILGLYDALETNGVIEAVIAAIPENEYVTLFNALDDIVEKYALYRNSFKGALEQLQMFVPQQVTELAETLQTADISNLDNIKALSEATGFQYSKEK